MKYSIEFMRIIAVILITFTHTRHCFQEGIPYFIFESLPTYGTAILSIISGYLYWTVSNKHQSIFNNKFKSLAIPYLIANLSVVILSLLLFTFFDTNLLNRYNYDLSLFTNGILALNEAPINPPTYFIRDIFILYVIIELIRNKNLWMLIIILPYLLFGKLFLRIDVVILFGIGVLYAILQPAIRKKTWILINCAVSITFYFLLFDHIKFPISFLIFNLLIDLKIPFFKTGGYSYLVHLYHSPIIVASYPIINLYIKNPIWSVLTQVSIACFFTLILSFITKKIPPLKVLTGGR